MVLEGKLPTDYSVLLSKCVTLEHDENVESEDDSDSDDLDHREVELEQEYVYAKRVNNSNVVKEGDPSRVTSLIRDHHQALSNQSAERREEKNSNCNPRSTCSH